MLRTTVTPQPWTRPPRPWLCRWVGGRRWEVEGGRRKAEGGMVRWHAKLRSDTFPLCYFLETFKVALECLSWRRKGVSRLQVKGTYDIWQVGEQERSGGDRMEWVARWVGRTGCHSDATSSFGRKPTTHYANTRKSCSGRRGDHLGAPTSVVFHIYVHPWGQASGAGDAMKFNKPASLAFRIATFII